MASHLSSRQIRLVHTTHLCSSMPADRWNLDSLLTTLGAVCVRTPTGPPYGVMGKIWVVPRSVDTATRRLSELKAMS